MEPSGSIPTGPFIVVAADKISASGLEPLTSDDRFSVEVGEGWDREHLRSALANAHALIVRSSTTVDEDLLEAAPNLRVIGRAGVGVDNIDLEAATSRGIPVINAPAGNTVSAAEHTMALILSVARRIAAADRSIRAGEWDRSRYAGRELRGKVLGLVGAGRIGGEVVKRARAFGMRVIAHDPYLTPERAAKLGVVRVDLGELIARADVITLHLPLTPATEGLIGREELAAMKPTALLINVARGGIVDEDALVDALEAGELAGAALDVFVEEPLPEGSRLLQAPGVVLTPHLGAATVEAQELVASEIAQGIRAALLDGDLSRAVNAPAIGGTALRRLRPLLDLGRKVGRVAGGMSEGGIRRIEVHMAGAGDEALRPLCSAALAGVLAHVVGEQNVNYVNAHHVTEARGIKVSRALVPDRQDYSEFIEVVVEAEGGSVRIAGALLGEAQHPRIVRIDDFELSVQPQGSLLVLRNRDVPGVIGKVGTLLADHDVNIAEYVQARGSTEGIALAAVCVDGDVGAGVAPALEAVPEILEAKIISLGE